MFEDVGEQFHQFIASSRSSLPPLSLPFPLHGTAPTLPPTFPPTFDPFPNHPQHPPIHLQTHINLPQLHHKEEKEEEEGAQGNVSSTNLFRSSGALGFEGARSITEHLDPWSSEELLALHKIRSGLDSWFPEFTWEHVSRKLEDLGFKRSAEKCKEKFEEENRNFSSMSYHKNYRIFNELEVLCQNDQNTPILAGKDPNTEKLHDEQVLDKGGQVNNVKEGSGNEIRNCKSISSAENEKKLVKEKIKRKRHREIENLKGFCQEIVRKMMAQQEEMINKVIEDMGKREEDKIAKEEAWKKQEMERMNKEIEIRAHEQAIASERQTKLIEFLQKITSNASKNQSPKMPNDDSLAVSNSSISSKPLNHNPVSSPPNPSFLDNKRNQIVSTNSNESLPPQNPSPSLAIIEQEVPTSSLTKKTTQNLNLARNEGGEIGKRWPREEVLALINLRGSINGNNNNEEKEGVTNPRGPLWERISQGMSKMGYERSAKRCKEKWENINKYFRKTRGVSKKRSVDSRTCPYFQQLSTMYSQGSTLVGPMHPPKISSSEPDNRLQSDQGVPELNKDDVKSEKHLA